MLMGKQTVRIIRTGRTKTTLDGADEGKGSKSLVCSQGSRNFRLIFRCREKLKDPLQEEAVLHKEGTPWFRLDGAPPHFGNRTEMIRHSANR